MDEAEAKKLLDANQPTQLGPQAAAMSAATPNIAATPPAPSIAGQPTVRRAEEAFRTREEEPGVPLDVSTGASPWERLMIDFRRNRENQISYLENKYGKDTVRLTRDGELIVRVPDSEHPGKVKDLLVQPHGKMTASDFIDLSASVPEIAGWVAGEKIAARSGMMPKNRLAAGALKLGAGAVGAEATGAVTKDIPMDVYQRGTIDLPEILKSRAGMAAADVGVGAAAKGVANFFRIGAAPMHGFRGEMQFDALEAQKYLKEKYGVDVPLSIGESTGVPLFLRSEAFVEKEPGGAGPLRKVKGQQEGQLRRLQSIMMGNPPLDEETGAKAIQEIQGKIDPVVQAEGAKRQALAQTSQSAIEGILNERTSPNRELYKAALGKDIRAAIIGKRDAAKAEADRLYGIVKSIPGGEGKVFEGEDLQKAFADIKESLPAPEQIVNEPTGLLDAQGNEITRDVPSQKPLRYYVPENILNRLNEVIGLSEPKFSLSDLQQMRREVYDDISKGEGVPGLGVHYLNDIGKAITGFIQGSIDQLPNGDLKTALKAADAHYKKNVIPFNRVGLTEFFRAVDEPGGVADNQIVNRAIGGDNAYRNWQLLKDTLGQKSPQFTRLRRAVVDNLLENSRDPGDQTLDAKSLVKNMYQFRNQYREISDDVLSPKEAELFRQARFLSYAQGDKIPVDELQKLLKSPNPTAASLKALIDAENKKDLLYKNQILKGIADGKIDEGTLHPTEFVNRLLTGNKIGLKETQQVLDLIKGNQPLVDELRQKTFEKIFRDAARTATASDVNRVMSGDRTHILSGSSIVQALKDPKYKEKVAAILGLDAYKDLTQYVKLTAPLEAKEEAYALAGGLAAGSRIGQLERAFEGRGGLLRFANNTMRSFVYSWLLSNPASRWWLSRVPSDPMAARTFAATVLTSGPFVQAVAKQFPGVVGARFMTNLKDSIQDAVTRRVGQRLPLPPSGNAPIGQGDKEAFWNQELEKVGQQKSPAQQKAEQANELSRQHPDWSRERVLQEVK